MRITLQSGRSRSGTRRLASRFRFSKVQNDSGTLTLQRRSIILNFCFGRVRNHAAQCNPRYGPLRTLLFRAIPGRRLVSRMGDVVFAALSSVWLSASSCSVNSCPPQIGPRESVPQPARKAIACSSQLEVRRWKRIAALFSPPTRRHQTLYSHQIPIGDKVPLRPCFAQSR
jgi:hypothetical protein